jgi:1,4-alpha-glucan branching enzyme
VVKTARTTRRKRVRFSCQAPDAQAVYLAGTFNGWDCVRTPMLREADGQGSIDVALTPGRYEYKFIVDGQWCCEPGQLDEFCEAPECVCNEHGTTNRVIEVS